MQVNRSCVTNPEVVRNLRFVRSRMLDVIESGDSLLATGGGFHTYNEFACCPRECGGRGYMGGVVYGTGLLTAGMNGMNSYSLGYGLTLQQGGVSAVAATNGAPAANEAFFSPRDYAETLGTPGYVYITGAAGPTSQFGIATGVSGSFVLPFTEAWSFITRHGKFTAGTTCVPMGRLNLTPFTSQAGFQNLTMNFTGTAGATELQTRAITLAAVQACAPYGLQVLFSGTGGSLSGASGATPALIYWLRLIGSKTVGLSFSPLIDKAGKTVLDHYNALDAMPATELANWLIDLLKHQTDAGQPEKLMIYIEGGPNDAGVGGAAQTSLDGVNTQQTKAGFKYTLREFIRLWKTKIAAAILNGAPANIGNEDQVTFALIGPHVVEESTRQGFYTQYTEAMAEVAAEDEFKSHTFAWDWTKCMTTAEALSGSWYANGISDQIHLSQTGNREMSGHLWKTLDAIAFGTASRLDRSARVLRGNRP